MVNILFLHSSSELYGSDRSLLNIVNNINKKQFKVYVVLPCQGPLLEEMKKIKDVQIDLYEVAVLRRKNLSLKGGISYFVQLHNSIKYLKDYIREKKIDIVDTNTAVVFPGAIAAKRSKKKSVWHIREIIKNKYENKVISFMMEHYSDLIIANSKATGEALNVSQEKIRVVYNAVEDKKENRKDHKQFTVGMAGRINRWKGQKLFIDMAEKVHEKYQDVLFEIAGEAYEGEEYLKTDIQNYIDRKKMQDYVILLGQVNDMSQFYSKIDLFVLPSTQPEPFGLVLIEAMEYGVPVIATNHGGPVEIIRNGVDGYLVDYNDCDEMFNRVIMLLESSMLRCQMGKAAMERKKEKFSISAMVKGVEEVFTEVCVK